MIQDILVLGAGTAGLLAAIAFKRKAPQLDVRVVRSPEIGVIGVGEGTTPNFPRFLFDYLGISRGQFYKLAQPTWKLGIKFIWGPRDAFFYAFSQQLDSRWPEMSRPTGFYADDDFSYCDLPSALMAEGKVFTRQPGGEAPDVQPWHAFHMENAKFVEILELLAKSLGVEIIDGKVGGADRGPDGITQLHLDGGRTLSADLYIDASGFRSELLGKAMGEPFVKYDNALFCDRAVLGGWDRGPEEPILPYTTAETMDAGWSWQIEHEHHVNRGYVFSSAHMTDEQAVEEFTRKNPKAPKLPRIVKFRSGRYERMWVGNVIGIGNAAGFVEPLEATAIMTLCSELQTLIDMLTNCGFEPTPTLKKVFNKVSAGAWDDIRDFLALHYVLNTRIDTPFWRRARNETDLGDLPPLLEYYAENGPTGYGRYLMRQSENDFGMEGYLVMLVGNKTPYAASHTPTPAEQKVWTMRREQLRAQAKAAMTVKQALGYVHHPGWRWNGDGAAV